MGKRKKSSGPPQGPKKVCDAPDMLTRQRVLILLRVQKDGLPTVFTCLFCNHENSVTVKIDKKAGVGQLDCRICGQKFQCAVNCRRDQPETTR